MTIDNDDKDFKKARNENDDEEKEFVKGKGSPKLKNYLIRTKTDVA